MLLKPFESAAIQNPRQRVAQCVRKHLSFVALALRDIDERHREIIADRFADDAQPTLDIRRLVPGLETDRHFCVAWVRKVSELFAWRGSEK
jgi:hypothetical protein